MQALSDVRILSAELSVRYGFIVMYRTVRYCSIVSLPSIRYGTVRFTIKSLLASPAVFSISTPLNSSNPTQPIQPRPQSFSCHVSCNATSLFPPRQPSSRLCRQRLECGTNPAHLLRCRGPGRHHRQWTLASAEAWLINTGPAIDHLVRHLCVVSCSTLALGYLLTQRYHSRSDTPLGRRILLH